LIKQFNLNNNLGEIFMKEQDPLHGTLNQDSDVGLTFPEYLRSLKIQRLGETTRLQLVSQQLQAALHNFYEASRGLEKAADLLEKRE
jgi:hypothetical protein